MHIQQNYPINGHPRKKTPQNFLGCQSQQRATNAKNPSTPSRSICNAGTQRKQSQLTGHPRKKTRQKFLGWPRHSKATPFRRY